MNERKWDVIVIGGGPAGLSAAIYTARADLASLVLDESNKLLEKVKNIENYFGFPEGLSGKELLDRGRKQAIRFGAVVQSEKALLIKITGDGFQVETADNSYNTTSLVLAPGVQHKKPMMEGIEKYEGKGVSYCVTCDAPLLRNRKVGLVGSEDLVVKEAIELFQYTQDIKILTNNRELQATEPLLKRMEELDIPVDSRKITGIFGDDKFQGVHFEDGKEEMDGLMIAEGTSGSLDFANSLGLRVKDGNVVVDENQFTGMPNVYAAGDCTPGARQIGAAVGEGSEAAINLINDIRGKQHVDWRH